MPLSIRTVRLRWQTTLTLAAAVLVIIGANIVAGDLADALSIEIRPINEDLVHRMIMASAAAYTILLSIPFVPGVEIGLAIIGVLGPKIVPLIYVCTMLGLTASFLVGRLIPLRAFARLCEDLHLTRTSELLVHVAPMGMTARLEFLVQTAPSFLVPSLLRHRYLALAIALNLPGNFLLGGGGGIGLVAGVSGLYSPAGFVATVAVAISPVPVAILLFGSEILPG